MTPHSQATDAMIGQVLDGRFELTEFIAAGGMGRVYKATQRALDRTVAVKLLADFSDGMEEFQKRFFLEASLCARLSHPNIIRIFDYGCHADTTFYIAMEYLEGRTVKQLMQETGPLHPRHAVGILKQVCAALIEAHGAGLVHRDLKPSNLFACPDGVGGEFIKILDFGVVKQMAVDMEFTHVGATLGSPPFMSPEQIQDHDVDGRSDLYTLGIILFQMLTGKLPFTASNPVQVLMKHITDAPPTFAEANPSVQVTPVLEEIVRRTLAKSRDDRYSSAREMLDVLTAAEADLPEIDGSMGSGLGDSSPDDSVHGSGEELLTGTMTYPGPEIPDPPTHAFAYPDTEVVPQGSTVELLQGMDLQGYIAFIDLNCPYCYALFERISRWGVAGDIEWCMVEHASHVLDGPFDLYQEQLLSNEVFEVHHRAPDIELLLPSHRCRSTTATRLIVQVQRQFPDQVNAFRQAIYRALWQDDLDIGDPAILTNLLRNHDMPLEMLDMCEVEPPELTAWQNDWDSADFDHCIPVLTHPGSDRVLIGLADERTLIEFFMAQRARVIDSTVCYYQKRPSILVCGWMSHLWQLLTDVRDCCEVLQAPTTERAAELLSEWAVPDLLVIEGEHLDTEALEHLARLARTRSVPWVVANRAPTPEEEVRVLSMGAVEYLPVTGEAEVARARLGRILRDRYNLERIAQETKTDGLTRLATRRTLLERLEVEWGRAIRTLSPLSFVLLNLDGFKAYNKIHGYLSGDHCLTEVAGLLSRQVQRQGDLLARFGGNEFAVLLPATAEAEAADLSEQFRRSISSARIENRGLTEPSFLTASAGVHTITPSADASLHELVDGAYRDLRAKRERSA